MNRKLFYFSLLSLSIAACSSGNNRQAHGDFDYAKNEEPNPLNIPEGLAKPRKKQEFYIPEVADSNAPVGEEMDIRAPSLVIPMAAGSRIEGNEGEAKVWFDQVIDSKNLLDFVRDALKSQLSNDGVALSPVGKDELVFESDWYRSTKESGYWLFKEIEQTESMRFKYTLEAKPHGRSVAIKVDLIDYSKNDATGSMSDINSIEKHRAEMAMLNTLIGEVDYQYRIYKHQLLQEKAKQINVSLGTNDENQAALIVNMDLDSLWTSIPTFFRENGLEVTDLNESKHIYFLTFKKVEESFWSSMWGDEKPSLDLAEGKYQFIFTEQEDKTAVTVLDSDGNVLPAQKLETLLPAMESGLSFESLF